MGYIYFKNKEYEKSKQEIEYVLKEIDENDVYSNLFMGFYYFQFLNNMVEQERIKKYETYSLQYLERALVNDGNNIMTILNISSLLGIK
jgi:hypothetical protein